MTTTATSSADGRKAKDQRGALLHRVGARDLGPPARHAALDLAGRGRGRHVLSPLRRAPQAMRRLRERWLRKRTLWLYRRADASMAAYRKCDGAFTMPTVDFNLNPT